MQSSIGLDSKVLALKQIHKPVEWGRQPRISHKVMHSVDLTQLLGVLQRNRTYRVHKHVHIFIYMCMWIIYNINIYLYLCINIDKYIEREGGRGRMRWRGKDREKQREITGDRQTDRQMRKKDPASPVLIFFQWMVQVSCCCSVCKCCGRQFVCS